MEAVMANILPMEKKAAVISTLHMTPAMAAGIERDFWTVEDLVGAAA